MAAGVVIPVFATDPSTRAQFIERATLTGLRVGGGSAVDPGTGIPSDWNHVDTGARCA